MLITFENDNLKVPKTARACYDDTGWVPALSSGVLYDWGLSYNTDVTVFVCPVALTHSLKVNWLCYRLLLRQAVSYCFVELKMQS